MTAPAIERSPWQASIDPRLIARLMRVQRPGLLGSGLARRILAGVDALAGRLPLLARFPRAKSGERAASSVPIVHVAPAGMRSAGGAAEAASIAGRPERAAGAVRPVAPGRIVERVAWRTERTTDLRPVGSDEHRAPGSAGAEPRARVIQRADAGPSPAIAAARVHTMPEATSAGGEVRTPVGTDRAAIAAMSPAPLPPGRSVAIEPTAAPTASQQPIVHAPAALAGAGAARGAAASQSGAAAPAALAGAGDTRRAAASQSGAAAPAAPAASDAPAIAVTRAGEPRHEPLVERAPVAPRHEPLVERAPVAPGHEPAVVERAAGAAVVVAAVSAAQPLPQTVHAVVTGAAAGGDGGRSAATRAAERSSGAADPAAIASPPAQRPTLGAAVARSDAPGRRSRMGAPLATPHASQLAPRTAPVQDTPGERPGPARPALERPRPAPRRAIVHPRRVAPAGRSPGLGAPDLTAPDSTGIADAAVPRVAPRRARSSDTPQAAAVAPWHLAAPAAGHAAPIVLPVVVPPQARPEGRGTAAPPLAHVAPPASAPPAVAVSAAPVAPGVQATVSPPGRTISGGGAAPVAQPPLDLRQIAAGVQQIFARQAEHERARRGIRR